MDVLYGQIGTIQSQTTKMRASYLGDLAVDLHLDAVYIKYHHNIIIICTIDIEFSFQ